MQTESQRTSEDKLIQSRLFNLSHGLNIRPGKRSLTMEMGFPWLSTLADLAPWTGCAELIAIDSLVDGERPVLLLDDFEGITLTSYLERQTIGTPEALALLERLAVAMDHLHAGNRVHGALRASSILIGEGMALRVVDWMVDWNQVPLPLLAEAAESLSPERLAGVVAGPRADQFSLGLLAHQLLVGRHPFPGVSLAERLFRLRFGLLDEGIFGETGFAMQAVFERVFSVDAEQRFDSCSAFVNELEKSPPQRSYADTRLLDVEDPQLQWSELSADPRGPSDSVEAGKSAPIAWWVMAAIFSVVAFVLGIANWRMQGRIDQANDLAEQLSASAAGGFQNGQFQFCNAAPEALDIRELAVAYWDANHQLRTFSSTAYTQNGWAIAPASSQFLSWPVGRKTVWDGSVVFYSLRVEQGRKEFLLSGHWNGNERGCLHLPS